MMIMKMMNKKITKVLCSLILASVLPAAAFAAESKNAIKLYNQAVELQNDENWYDASQYC